MYRDISRIFIQVVIIGLSILYMWPGMIYVIWILSYL